MNGSQQYDLERTAAVARSAREAINHHKGGTIWLTGTVLPQLAGIARRLDETFTNWGAHSYVLDAPRVLRRLDRNWGQDFGTPSEDARRIAEMAGLFADAGIITLVVAPNLGSEACLRACAALAPNEVVLVAITPSNGRTMSVQLRCMADTEGAGVPRPSRGFLVYSDRGRLSDDSRQADVESIEAAASYVVDYMDDHGYFWDV